MCTELIKGGTIMTRKFNHGHDPFYETKASTNNEEQHNTIDEVSEQSFLEETSTEFTHPIDGDERTDETHHVYGWIGLALSIISLFFVPYLFAIAGIIVGIIARNRRSPALGYSAIVIGAISIVIHLAVMPFF